MRHVKELLSLVQFVLQPCFPFFDYFSILSTLFVFYQFLLHVLIWRQRNPFFHTDELTKNDNLQISKFYKIEVAGFKLFLSNFIVKIY